MSEPEKPEYLTVAEVAARLKVTERTVQKRCAAGKLAAQLVSTPDGDRWQIDPANFDANEAPERTRTPARTDANGREQNEATELKTNSKAPEPDANDHPNGREQWTRTDANAAELLAQSREEILFLRGLVEQRDRDAAELRAALRKALEAMPKALPDGASTPTSATENQSRENAPQAPIIATGDKTITGINHGTKEKKSARRMTGWQRGAARVLGIR